MGLHAANDEAYDANALAARQPSVGHLFRHRAEHAPERDAFQFFRRPAEGATGASTAEAPDELVTVSWAQTKEIVYDWAAGLIALGVNLEDRVAIASQTRIEWVYADLAIMCAGAATTTVYPSAMAGEVAFVLANSGSRVVVAENGAQVEKLIGRRTELPDVAKVVVLDGTGDGDWVISLDDLVALGRERRAAEPECVDQRIDQLTPDHLATIIYTSGTTGRPKGAELTHDAIVYEGASVKAIDIIREDDLQFLWLPLSHVFGKVLLAIALECGCATAVDGRIDKIIEHLAIVQPTWMGAAPRIFEKAKAKIGLTFAHETGPKAKLIEWALGVGAQMATVREEATRPSPLLAAQWVLADKLVLSKVRDRFGGRVKFFISGSAALDPDVARWFASVGLLIIEGYGLTETSAATCVNRPHTGSYKFGTIGWPMPGTDVALAADGELLVRGPGVMRGYHDDPETTESVTTDDGFFRTGDIATIDDRGFVTITDRKKDVFKTSGGKYIAPSHIEAHFKGLCPYVSQFLVIGEGKNFASALVTLDADAIRGWAKEAGLTETEYAGIVASQAARDLVQGYVDELNTSLNRWETIKKFTILDRDLTVESGELTPSLKLKRRVVAEHFSSAITELYS